MWSLNIFFQSVVYLFIPSAGFLTEEKFFILMKSTSSIFSVMDCGSCFWCPI